MDLFLDTNIWLGFYQLPGGFYRRLSSFFGERFPDIRLAEDLEKHLLLRDLESAASAEEAHRALRRLCRFAGFTDEELNDLVEAALGQSAWIEEDEDIRDCLRKIFAGSEERLEPESRQRLAELLHSSLEPISGPL